MVDGRLRFGDSTTEVRHSTEPIRRAVDSNRDGRREGATRWASGSKASRKAQDESRRSVVGRISMTRHGYGFVDAPDGDFYVGGRDTNGAMHGDTVAMRPDTQARSRRAEAASSCA